MRIQTLTLKNFRSHRETSLELDRFNFLRGPNGCGKSSIQMALEYLFTGRCQLTDRAGRGAEALIRSGEKELEVTSILENGDTICRRRTSRSQVIEINGRRVPADSAEVFLEKRFGSAEALSAVLNVGGFIEMSEAGQKKLLARLVDAGKTERFTENLNRHLARFGFMCNAAIEPFEVRVSSSKEHCFGLFLEQLSGSERFQFGVALQTALAMVSGFRFVVIDRADVLDKERRRLLTTLLLHSDIDQAIVLATGEEPPPTVVPQGVKFFDLTNAQESVKKGVIEPPLAIDIRHQGRHDAPETSLHAPRPTP